MLYFKIYVKYMEKEPRPAPPPQVQIKGKLENVKK